MLRTMLKRLLLTILFLAALGVIGFLMLPFALNRYVLPPILDKAGFSARQATITRVSPYRLNASLELGSENQPLVSLPRIELRFSPRSLWHRKIDELIIDHGEINLLRQGNRLVLPTMPDKDVAIPKNEAEMNLFLLPVSVKRIIFKQCTLILHAPRTRELGIGFSGLLEPEFQGRDQAQLLQSLSGTFEFFNDLHARISISARFGKDRHSIEAKLDRATLSLPPKMVPTYLQGLEFSELLAELSLNLEAGSLSLLDYRLDGELRDPHYISSTLSLQGAGPRRSAHFALSGSTAGHRFLLESIAMQAPYPAVVSVTGNASYPDGVLQAAGQLQADLGAGAPIDGTKLPLRLAYEASGSSEKGYNLHISGGLSSTQPLALTGNLTISEPADIALSMDVKSDQNRLKTDFSITSSALAINRKGQTDLRLKTSDLKITGRYQNLSDSSALLLKGTVSRLSAPDHQTELRGISFQLPLDPFFSSPAKIPPGSLKIGSISLEGRDLFALAATTEQAGPVFNLKGDLLPLFPSGPELRFTGSANQVDKSVAVTWTMPLTSISDKTLPALSLLPIPDNLHFEAQLEANGTVSYEERRLGGSLRAAIRDAGLKIDDKNISISGIDCAISMPRLPELVSEPSQHCSIKTIAVSTLQFSDADLLFRVEDPNHLFIEKSSFSWCGGSLESGSLRLSRQNPDFNTTLYCSRIRLADLLTQFGFRGTEGEGSVNGRLPVRVSAKRLEIDDGFLFSTPGTGGIVRFSETDKLRQGIGAVSEAVYVNYSLMALEDFTYNWAKLSFKSRDEDLLMTLELDGKPSTALPFGFKKGIIVETDKGEGLQYPIRLDVNFRLPLAELFQMGQTINSIMGKN